MKKHMLKNENIIPIHLNLYWNCPDIDLDCNWKKYSQLKIWTLIILSTYLICMIAILVSPIFLFINDASFTLFALIGGIICLINLILITKYKNKMEYQTLNINYRISKIQKYIEDLKTCKIEYDINNETTMYLEFFTQICNHLYCDPLINSSKLKLKCIKNNECCLEKWLKRMQKIIKESKRNNKNLRYFSQILQENEETLMFEFQSLLQTTCNDKIYMLLHKIKINKDIQDYEFESEYERFAQELLMISDKKETFEIVCDQVSEVLKKYGKNAYQFSKIYLNNHNLDNKIFDVVVPIVAGSVFGSVCSQSLLELIDTKSFINNSELLKIVDILTPILIPLLIMMWFVLRSLKSYKKRQKRFYRIQNNDFTIVILKDFCNKHEREILDNKFPPATK